MTPTQEMRVLIGLVTQPLVAAVAAFVLFPALDYTAEIAGVYQGRASDPTGAAMSVAFGAALASVFVVVFGALPAIGWLSRRRPITLAASLIAGAVLGNLPSAFILLLATLNGEGPWSGGRPVALGLVRAIAFGSCVGMACGAAFWGIAGSAAARSPRDE
jgi:hypothetical protein